jgi:hypothetical protein
MVREYDPLKVVYEHYAFQADVEHLRERQQRENFLFVIHEAGGALDKDQRIERLIPKFRGGEIICPEVLLKRTLEGREVDIIKRFREVEYDKWPFNPKARDQLDALCRICDEDVNYVYPHAYGSGNSTDQHWTNASMYDGGGSWLSQ